MNKLAIIAVVAASAVTFGIAGAYADDDFITADGNHDKTVTMEEAMGVYPTLTQVLFDQADANKDGTLDESEFSVLQGLTGKIGNGGSQQQDDASSQGGGSSSASN